MAVPLSSLIRPRRGPVLAALERLAPAPPDDLLAAEIEARTAPGDVVLELHGRGGWVARVGPRPPAARVLARDDRAHARSSRRSCSVRPTCATSTRRSPTSPTPRAGSVGLRESIAQGFASHVPRLRSARSRVEEFIWDLDGDVPARRVVPLRALPDRARRRASRPGRRRRTSGAPARSPRPRGRERAARPLPGARTPATRSPPTCWGCTRRGRWTVSRRSSSASSRSSGRPRSRPRCGSRSCTWRCRPAASTAIPGGWARSRSSTAGVKPPAARQFRERDPWLLFEEGVACRPGLRPAPRRPDHRPPRRRATAATWPRSWTAPRTSSLRQGSAGGSRPSQPAPAPGGAAARGEQPRQAGPVAAARPLDAPRPSASPTSRPPSALGYDAAATLPLEALFGRAPRGEWAWDAAALRRSLGSGPQRAGARRPRRAAARPDRPRRPRGGCAGRRGRRLSAERRAADRVGRGDRRAPSSSARRMRPPTTVRADLPGPAGRRPRGALLAQGVRARRHRDRGRHPPGARRADACGAAAGRGAHRARPDGPPGAARGHAQSTRRRDGPRAAEAVGSPIATGLFGEVPGGIDPSHRPADRDRVPGATRRRQARPARATCAPRWRRDPATAGGPRERRARRPATVRVRRAPGRARPTLRRTTVPGAAAPPAPARAPTGTGVAARRRSGGAPDGRARRPRPWPPPSGSRAWGDEASSGRPRPPDRWRSSWASCASPTTRAWWRSSPAAGGCATPRTPRRPARRSRIASSGPSSACCPRPAGITEAAFFDRIADDVPGPRHAGRGAGPRVPRQLPCDATPAPDAPLTHR